MINHIKRGIKTVIEECCTVGVDEKYSFEENIFCDKVAVVTGGTGDIGSAIAERIVAQGGRVVLTGRKHSEPVQTGEKEKFIYWDLSNLSDREEKFQDCVRCFGKIDIWINCAGYISHNDLQGDFLHATEEEWKKQMDINGKALYFLTQTVAGYFKDNKISGHIVQVLSIDGIRDTWQPYGISKRVALRFTEGIAETLKPYGIIVSGVAPGGGKNTDDRKNTAWYDTEKQFCAQQKDRRQKGDCQYCLFSGERKSRFPEWKRYCMRWREYSAAIMDLGLLWAGR